MRSIHDLLQADQWSLTVWQAEVMAAALARFGVGCEISGDHRPDRLPVSP